jgi:elongation factor 1-gamma
MDSWKKVYSNEETSTIAIPYFWKNFDKEGYSIWFAEYRYNNELGQMFMTSNLIKGMFQRLEKLMKTCFASLVVFGTSCNAAIAGIWVFRGQGVAFDVSIDSIT